MRTLRRELRAKTQEVEKLGSIRDEVENELTELTANLFQVRQGLGVL